MNTVLPSSEEMRERNILSIRYKNAQKKAKIDDEIRAVRTAINFLIEKEQDLLVKSEALKPARSKKVLGGA